MTVLRHIVWVHLAPNGRSRCGSALFSTPGELLSHSLLWMVHDSHSLPSLEHFWGQLCGRGWIHYRVHANNLAGWKTELWCPRPCLWPTSVTGLDALTGSQRYLDALGVSDKYVPGYLQTYTSLRYFWFPAAPCLFPFSLHLVFHGQEHRQVPWRKRNPCSSRSLV